MNQVEKKVLPAGRLEDVPGKVHKDTRNRKPNEQ